MHAPIIPATREPRQQNHLNLAGRDCGKPRSHHPTPAWVTRTKLHLKIKKKKRLAGWHTPIIPATWEAEIRESFKPKRQEEVIVSHDCATALQPE